MKKTAYVIGIDIGTQGTKAGLFDASGVCYAEAYEASALLHPAPGAVEQDPDSLYASALHTVREVLEIGVVADSILALSVTCGAVSVSREGAGVVLRTGASVRALYLDEGGVPLVAERSIDVSCQLELPEDCRVAARAVCPEEVQGSLTDRGIEVRFPVDFRAEAAQRVKRVCVSAGKINTDAPKETTGAPSLVLRCLGKQETAWDLAKRYNTTIGVILAANQLETEGDISRDQLLLIPRKRT